METQLSYRALIVEDSDVYAEMVEAMLKRMKLEADVARTGKAAIAYIQKKRPDLVLLDINLGGMTGWEVLDAIKEKYGEHTIPVIVTSAYSDASNRLVGKLQYVSHYLVKPFTAEQFKKAINEVLELDKVSV